MLIFNKRKFIFYFGILFYVMSFNCANADDMLQKVDEKVFKSSIIESIKKYNLILLTQDSKQIVGFFQYFVSCS